MSNARNIASGANFAANGDLTISSTAGQLKLTDTDGTEQNTTIKQSGGNVFIQARDNTNNAGIVFAGNGGGNYSEHMRIDASGRVTKSAQPQFILQGDLNGWTTINQSGQWLPFTGSSAVSTSTNNELAMGWRSNNYGGYNPSGNGINVSTGVYTAPVTGTYIFYFQSYMLKTSSSTEYIHINSYINGNDKQDFTIYFYNTGSTTYATPEITKIVRLAANDTFGFRLYSNQTNVFKIYPNYTCFAGYLLG